MELVPSPSNLFSQQAVSSPTGYPGCPPLNSSSSFSSMSYQLMLANRGQPNLQLSYQSIPLPIQRTPISDGCSLDMTQLKG